MNRPGLALDLDDVLSLTTDGIMRHGQDQGYPIEFGDVTSSAYWDAYGISEETAISLVHGYERAGYPGLAPTPGAQEGVNALSEVFDLTIVTARDAEFEVVTRAWIQEYFGSVFQSIVHVGNRYVSEVFRSKPEVCHELGAVAAVDDSPHHVLAYAQQGIRAYLFGGYDWQKVVEAHPSIERVQGWPETSERLLKQYG